MDNLDYEYIAELVTSAKGGDSNAFAELYVATYEKQYKFAYNYLHDKFLAQDAIQEAYILVLKNLGSLNDPNLFISWLNQITFRVCFSMQKKEKKFTEGTVNIDETIYEVPDEKAVDPEERVVNIDQKSFIIRQILSLPFTESQVIILHYYNNLNIEEIAKMMELSRSTVKRYLASGRDKLEKLVVS